MTTERSWERPLIWLHSDLAPQMQDCGCGERCWQVDSPRRPGVGFEYGGTFETFAEALVYARMLHFQAQLGWTVKTCWCGWSHGLPPGTGNLIAAHVIQKHPTHPVVRG